jgi:glutathione peroxidase
MSSGKFARLLSLLAAAAGSWGLPAASQPLPQPAATGAAPPSAGCPALLQHTFPRLQDEQPQSLCQYQGKVILVVNTASYCGFTSQYQGLEALFQQYKGRGLVVLGFPSNDFLQEKKTNQDIADFCYNTYGIVFPMFAKTSVRGRSANRFYQQLAEISGKSPRWNFNKYLIDRSGRNVTHFGSTVAPDNPAFLAQINQLLSVQ